MMLMPLEYTYTTYRDLITGLRRKKKQNWWPTSHLAITLVFAGQWSPRWLPSLANKWKVLLSLLLHKKRILGVLQYIVEKMVEEVKKIFSKEASETTSSFYVIVSPKRLPRELCMTSIIQLKETVKFEENALHKVGRKLTTGIYVSRYKTSLYKCKFIQIFPYI